MRLRTIITGAGSGFGEATSRLLAKRDHEVILADINFEAAEMITDELRAKGHSAFSCFLDVTKPDSWDALLSEFGYGISGLVNNAGLVRFGKVAETAVEDWQLLKSVMLDGAYHGIIKCAPIMEATGGGAIVNVGSRHAAAPAPGEAAYAAVKAAMRMMAKCAALEWARKGVRINSVLPGPSLTGILQNMPRNHRDKLGDQDELVANLKDKVPLGRLAEPSEIATCIAFLLSDEASFLTGSDLFADGGISI